jgi:hypothetical protein
MHSIYVHIQSLFQSRLYTSSAVKISSGYNSSLVTWTVIRLTAAKFKFTWILKKSVRTSQKTYFHSVTKVNRLIMFSGKSLQRFGTISAVMVSTVETCTYLFYPLKRNGKYMYHLLLHWKTLHSSYTICFAVSYKCDRKRTNYFREQDCPVGPWCCDVKCFLWGTTWIVI